jgi:hypothetical protein
MTDVKFPASCGDRCCRALGFLSCPALLQAPEERNELTPIQYWGQECAKACIRPSIREGAKCSKNYSRYVYCNSIVIILNRPCKVVPWQHDVTRLGLTVSCCQQLRICLVNALHVFSGVEQGGLQVDDWGWGWNAVTVKIFFLRNSVPLFIWPWCSPLVALLSLLKEEILSCSAKLCTLELRNSLTGFNSTQLYIKQIKS